MRRRPELCERADNLFVSMAPLGLFTDKKLPFWFLPPSREPLPNEFPNSLIYCRACLGSANERDLEL